MSGPFRIAPGLVDTQRKLAFRFDGRLMHGHPGDTLAAALLANGQHLVGRSFKYHRPRGIFSAGVEEPNALLQLAEGARQDPNTRATMVELTQGLVARSQNHHGPLSLDPMAVLDLLAPVLTAGFYYKTFMWPRRAWQRLYEPLIRRAAGLGRLSGLADPDRYDKGFLYCDLLVIGAGPAGLAAALAAARTGARVILAETDFLPGGRLTAERDMVDSRAGASWAAEAVARLDSMDNVQVRRRSTVVAAYDHGIFAMLQQRSPEAPAHRPRMTLWQVHARRTLVAAGATEQPIAFANNDRPGIMLAGAARAYLNRFGVAVGRRVAVFTNNDDGWRTARDLAAAGVRVAAVIDSRAVAPPLSLPDVPTFMDCRVIDTAGRLRVRRLFLSNGKRLDVDCLAVSGGWSPNVHLTCHHGARPRWSPEIAAFVPGNDPGNDLPPGMRVAGAANGALTLGAALRDGHEKALALLNELGIDATETAPPRARDEPARTSPQAHVPQGDVLQGRGRAWLDLQNDVSVKDVAQAWQEGYRAVEHVKRYTTLGMATDQGRTSNLPALGVLAALSGRGMDEIGTTMFRPPVVPVPIAAMAGAARGQDYRPTRLTPSHAWAHARGARFVATGDWMRAQYFPRPGEKTWRESVDREVRMTRAGVGVCDVSTLGKIDIQGRDAGAFLDRIYVNAFAGLPVGKVRYGLMLREDGFALDDGTTARLSETHYVMTTTTANAGRVMAHLEFARQCLWPGLDVHLTSVTDAWAQFAVAGPSSRALLRRIVDPDFDLSGSAFPFMACATLTVCQGVPARLFRISFSGELAYELAVPRRYGDSMAQVLMDAGRDLDVVPYGTEALGVMRIEKGHAAGPELNGQTTALNLGLDRMISARKDCIGKVMAQRPALVADDCVHLVGLVPVDPDDTLVAGAHVLFETGPEDLAHDQGWISSAAWSPTLGHAIGLGFVRGGRTRMGQRVRVVSPLTGQRTLARITSAHFVDPQGERLRD